MAHFPQKSSFGNCVQICAIFDAGRARNAQFCAPFRGCFHTFCSDVKSDGKAPDSGAGAARGEKQGTLQGAAYGGVTELTGTGGGLIPGLVFGGALFAVADEVAVPALGLSGKPSESPLSSHLYGLAAHVVYGLSTELARRGLRAAI
jgi:hypothetical protein